ncbi:MAG: hypothetical protein J6O99_01475, partial [Methanobrevibacter sp.]|nr:hypothetical protein [Methanobrevibacter sp.]
THEIVELINDPKTEIHKKWKERYKNYENVVLYEQVNRIVYEAKKNKSVAFVEFTRGEKGKKVYFAFLIDDVISYIIKKKASNIKFVEKE